MDDLNLLKHAFVAELRSRESLPPFAAVAMLKQSLADPEVWALECCDGNTKEEALAKLQRVRLLAHGTWIPSWIRSDGQWVRTEAA